MNNCSFSFELEQSNECRLLLQIAFESSRVTNCTMFDVNLNTETTYCIELPHSIADHAIPSPLLVQQNSRLNINTTSKPFKFHPNGYV